MARVLLISNDVIGPQMAGPGIRYHEMALILAREHAVALAAPDPSQSVDRELIVTPYQTSAPKSLLPLIEKADVVIAQNLHPVLLRAMRQRGIVYIADLYDPIVLENLEAQRETDLNVQTANHEFYQALTLDQLATANHILCASDRQRDYWLGLLTAMGRITPELYREDPSLDSLISLLPFGYSGSPMKMSDPHAVGEVIPRFNPKKDKLILWGGGVWNWFDPLSLIKAVEKLSRERNDIKLLFLGTKHPNPQMPEMRMVTAAHDLAERLKVLDTQVFFREGWLPYDELPNFFLQASIGVSTHFDHAETRFSFRTRILSYISARAPILATTGDAMSDLIEREGLGLTVDYEDVDGIAEAITELLDNKQRQLKIARNYERVWPYFTWDNLVTPLSARITEGRFAEQRLGWWDFQKLQLRYLASGGKKVWQNKGLTGLVKKIRR